MTFSLAKDTNPHPFPRFQAMGEFSKSAAGINVRSPSRHTPDETQLDFSAAFCHAPSSTSDTKPKQGTPAETDYGEDDDHEDDMMTQFTRRLREGNNPFFPSLAELRLDRGEWRDGTREESPMVQYVEDIKQRKGEEANMFDGSATNRQSVLGLDAAEWKEEVGKLPRLTRQPSPTAVIHSPHPRRPTHIELPTDFVMHHTPIDMVSNVMSSDLTASKYKEEMCKATLSQLHGGSAQWQSSRSRPISEAERQVFQRQVEVFVKLIKERDDMIGLLRTRERVLKKVGGFVKGFTLGAVLAAGVAWACR